jgi:mono/diheme cytochrome c family protein
MAHFRTVLGGGATGVSPVHQHGRGRPCLHEFLKMVVSAVVVSGTVILAGCRNDMHDQPRFKTYAMNTFYPDLRSARQPVEGTVARGQLNEDTYFYTGKIGANPGDYMPFPVTEEVLSRGRERFNIYCAPCHSRLGNGKGMVVQRGFKQPPSYHDERLRKAPLGYFFDVMTNGFGAMPDYATQIPPRDRWCIVAYIRALQLSQNATQADVAGQQFPVAAPQFTEPGSGATLPTELPESKFTREEQGSTGEQKK